MKVKNRLVKKWKTSSLAGFGLAGAGLAGAVILIAQLAPSLVDGTTPQVSSVGIAIESTVSLVLLMSGFALMVIGSDPFEDVTQDFRSDREWNA